MVAISSKEDPHYGRARLTHTLRGLLKIRELNKTRQRLIRRKATELGLTVEVTELIAQGAFEDLSAATARSTTRFLNVTIVALADQVDVVVLAQVSKERLVPALGALPVPVLSSPRSGVEAA